MNIFSDARVDELSATIRSGMGQIICYTKLSKNEKSLVLGATDGMEVWKSDLNEEDIESLRAVAEVSSKDLYLSHMRTSFMDGNLQASQVPSKVLITFGKDSGAFTIDLYETTAQEGKLELQCLLLLQQKKIKSLEKELKDANETLSAVHSQTAPEETSSSTADERVTKKPRIANQRQKKGESLINPGRRRLKDATGVDFD